MKNAITTQLEKALQTVRSWPADRQDDLAEVIAEMQASTSDVYHLSPEERADVELSLAQAEAGQFATNAEVAAVLKRHGL